VGLLRDLSLRLQEQLREKERAEKELEAYRDQLEEMVEKRTTDLSGANIQLKQEVIERKRAEESLQYRIEFENLISDISTRFISLTPDDIDQEIETTLDKIGRFANTDAVYVFIFTDEKKQFRLTYLWQNEYSGLKKGDFVDLESNAFPLGTEQLLEFGLLVVPPIHHLKGGVASKQADFKFPGFKSFVKVPMIFRGEVIGLFGLGCAQKTRGWADHELSSLKMVGQIITNALMRKKTEQELKESFSEIERLRDQLQAENIYLREEIELTYKHEGIIGKSAAIKQVLAQVEQVAKTDATVLVLGETGTGKELLTRAIHNLSARKDRSMVKVNCAALPPTLIESELFGREKGAYTGAISKQAGRFEIANGSTIFLDEIGEIPMDLQTKLLRVLQEGQFERIGGTKTITVDVRVIAATNRDLTKAVQEGKFRQDLYYRLNVFPVMVPPLRKRPEDIPTLTWAFIKEFEKTMGKRIETVPQKSMEAMQRYPWPGNVRELKNVIEQAMIISKNKVLKVQMPGSPDSETLRGLTLESVERKHIVEILQRTEWRVSGKNGAAELLGLKPTTLEARMKKLRIKRPVSQNS
jgi:transcriptional regulator with GAF, ATPase, and Fis domain